LAATVKKNTIVAFQVLNPEQFGIVKIDSNDKTISIEEKPIKPRSNFVI